VSPESQSRDRREKYLEYEAAGIPEYRIADPLSRMLEAYPAGWPVYSHPGTRGAYRLPRRPRLVRAAGMAVGRAADERARRIGRADPRLTTPRSRVRSARATGGWTSQLSPPCASPRA